MRWRRRRLPLRRASDPADTVVDDARAALAVAVALDRQDLEAANEIEVEFGLEAVAHGGQAIIMQLLQELREHASQLGCDCGSSAWLDQLVAGWGLAE